MNVVRASAWANAVFHVLAHVDVPFAASCFSASYASWAAQTLGPTADRTLGDDARVLEQLAREDEEAFSRAQAVAWVFRTTEAVHAASERELKDATVEDERAREVASSAGPIAEVLRAAAELELPLLASLPSTESALDAANLAAAFTRIAAAAPALAHDTIELAPALALRGRVLGTRIFVGEPGIAGATTEHVAWQAAHEATVMEVSAASVDAGSPLPFLELERRALGVLRSRARRAGLVAEHGRWLAHLDLRGLGGLGAIPDVDDAT